MRVLLVNDDGIDAKGMKALVDALSGTVELYISAPVRERSGAAMAVTLGRPVPVEKRIIPGASAAYGVDGTPVDCVKIALGSLLSERPDLLVSGINHGSNLGINVHYSGTVAAVIEGASQGLPGIAVSVPRHGPADFEAAARFLSRIVEMISSDPLPAGIILNINFPIAGEGLPRGVRLTKQCPAGIIESHKRVLCDDGREGYILRGKVDCVGTGTQMDNSAIMAGYVSITPLTMDLTDTSAFEIGYRYRFDSLISDSNK
ncbi:MAG: 5'/3'-nucleotidase SurE [Planctomycetota bacterium]|jgi:5'-nucleotidase